MAPLSSFLFVAAAAALSAAPGVQAQLPPRTSNVTASVLDTAQTARLRTALAAAGQRHYNVHTGFVGKWACYYADAAAKITAANAAEQPVPEGLPEAVDQIPQYLAYVSGLPEATEALYISEMEIADAQQELQDFVSELVSTVYKDDKQRLKDEQGFLTDEIQAVYYALDGEYVAFQTTTTDINKNYGCGKPGDNIVNEISMEEYMATVGLGTNTVYKERMAELNIVTNYVKENNEDKTATDATEAELAAGQISSGQTSGKNNAWLAAYIAIPCVAAIAIAGGLFAVFQRRKNRSAQASKHVPLQA
jgi:hypothetical protein|eukprot:TRINITY_DN3_c0_g1_i1.p2 TRINITY_DN3_c0_g1~~TRINITY_DN3_c0_g1_i1.p2  ORF type:complete len:306 (-),score=160.03 TRINITY_DN3_c0_g1_i1:73-990(-)